MQITDSIILGIIEGITEFLPISSTAHLLLAGKLLGIPDSELLKSFDVIIQLGAILAVVVLYPKKLLLDRQVLLRVSVAFIPTAVLGFSLYPYIKSHLLDAQSAILMALFLGGIFLIWFERNRPTSNTTIREMSLLKAASIGTLQCVSFLPGVSRAGASIIGGMYAGLSREEAVEFSFLLAVPTMAAATTLDIFKNYEVIMQSDKLPLVSGFIFAFITAIFAIKFLLRFVRQNDFTGFGVYRIVLALALFAYFYT